MDSGALYWVTEPDHFEHMTYKKLLRVSDWAKLSIREVSAMVAADLVTLCRAIVLACGGDLEEIVNG